MKYTKQNNEIKSHVMEIEVTSKAYKDESGNHLVAGITKQGKPCIVRQAPNPDKNEKGEELSTGFADPVNLSRMAKMEGEDQLEKVTKRVTLDKGGIISARAYYSEKQDDVNVFQVEKGKNGFSAVNVLAYNEKEAQDRTVKLKNATTVHGMIIGFDQGTVDFDAFEETFKETYQQNLEEGKGTLPVSLVQPVNSEGEVFAEPTLISSFYYNKEAQSRMTVDEAWESASKQLGDYVDSFGDDVPDLKIQAGRGFKVSPKASTAVKINIGQVNAEVGDEVFLRTKDATIRMGLPTKDGTIFATSASYYNTEYVEGKSNDLAFVNATPEASYLEKTKAEFSAAVEEAKNNRALSSSHTQEDEDSAMSALGGLSR